MLFKSFLAIIVAALFAGLVAAQDSARPNVLFVIADDWSGHAGIYGDRVVKTPTIDAIGEEGAVFLNAFTAAPSCTPSRAAILTGRFPHELEQGANLWGYLPTKFTTYQQLLQQNGYHVGLTGKGWGPGNFMAGGYNQNPAGTSYRDFATFLEGKPAGKPFSYWFGSSNPHRPYVPGSGLTSGLKEAEVIVPSWLPDVPEVRRDILDYYFEVEAFDRELAGIVNILKASGQYENTLIIITSDNGMPFPRAKANLYDAGAKVPLIISMPGKVSVGRVNEFVSLTDIAPTILELCGQEIPDAVKGSSLWTMLRGQKVRGRQTVFTERERHANVRDPELGYPSRAIRTPEYLYIRNYEPDRWPAGDPQLYHSVGPYGDIDASPSKQYIMDNRNHAKIAAFFTRGFGKRPVEELYDLRTDPDQLNNVSSIAKYRKPLTRLREQLHEWQVATGDPRASDGEIMFDRYPYFGPPVEGAPSTYKPPVE